MKRKWIDDGERKKIESIVRESREKNTPGSVAYVEVGRGLVTMRHCGSRMIQVKVFYKNHEEPGNNPRRGTDEHICPKCYFHVTGLSDLDSLV